MAFADLEGSASRLPLRAGRSARRIKVRIEEHSSRKKAARSRTTLQETTHGRPGTVLRDRAEGMPFEMVNRPLDKKAISSLINVCYRNVGLKETVIFADQLMYTGFAHSTRPVHRSVWMTSSFRQTRPHHC